MNYNVVNAQMGRGKVEKIVSFALANIASTLAKLSYDVCLYNSQNFNFISLPDEFTTGSSIMPHKKNPDVFELIRGKCNKMIGVPGQITLIVNNLPSGYFRDLQVVKELIIPLFAELFDCLSIADTAIGELRVNDKILDDPKYDNIFTVEEVNRLVMQGVSFREAYRRVGELVESGRFVAVKEIEHTHEGSIGNLCLEEIAAERDRLIEEFNLKTVEEAVGKLLSSY